MKNSSNYIDIDEIHSSVKLYKSNDIISTNESQNIPPNPDEQRSRKRKRYNREARATHSPSPPRRKDKGDLDKVTKKLYKDDPPGHINPQYTQGKDQLPSIQSPEIPETPEIPKTP